MQIVQFKKELREQNMENSEQITEIKLMINTKTCFFFKICKFKPIRDIAWLKVLVAGKIPIIW